MELSDEENDRVLNNFDSDDDRGNRSDEAEEEPAGNENGDAEDEETKRKIDPSTSRKRIVRNPLPKLNAERLQGPKGIQTIEKSFEGFKFQGKGHERSDLNTVMKRLEYWAHRLFPKYCFDDFIEKMETLGTKKNIQVFLKKYRLGMVDSDYSQVAADGEEEDNVERGEGVIEAEPIDEFDKLIAEQIEKQRAIDKTPAVPPPSQGNVLGSASDVKASELSDEIKARIEANKKLALERKMARAKRMEEEIEKQKAEDARKDSQMAKIQAQIHQEVLTNNYTNLEELPNHVEPNVETFANPSTSREFSTVSTNEEDNFVPSPNNEETNLEILSPASPIPEKSSENDETSEYSETDNRKRQKLDNSPRDPRATFSQSMNLENYKPCEMKLIKFVEFDKADEISGAEKPLKKVQQRSEDDSPELPKPMELPVETAVERQLNDFPHEKQKDGATESNSETSLTEEELLRAIDGAMEEIIGNSSIVL